MSKEKLIEIAKINKEHAENGTMHLVDDIVKIPASNYYDKNRWQNEIDLIFKRLPLVLGVSAEIPNPGDYKAMEVVGVPVIILRNNEGKISAFLNACIHRGAALVELGLGNKKRFSCPYHGWTYNNKGELMGISSNHEFGDLDKKCNSLISLPSLEKEGIIWVTLDPESKIKIGDYLSGYDQMLSHFGFKDWHVFQTRSLEGPNWKVAYDGYLDLYHLPVLHKDTFGDDMSNQAMYYEWGPHQRVVSPYRLPKQDDFKNDGSNHHELPIEEWSMDILMAGVWTIFPHISIASFTGGGRSVLLSQLLPGDSPESSITNQYYLMENKPSQKQQEEANKQWELLEYVVDKEDYETGLRLQKSLKTGLIDHVMFGRNEGGGQTFHKWVDKIINTKDKELPSLF
ncbi:MAG: aromatic ring-hydroxylating dioxygenase subunit alpha [Pseudomonadota bacterium]|nr:aromatic ring-hydroxylating dioxygenase subunit alpha [Pseudomonadota bacterium]MEC9392458.1 aromatic ring-hydroxylating dioxygenase subunit alpha [Pseudomonadota bacterium]MEC9459551.1 aromatic ring-hydroxylating dioxygenase subunit alpha [Pseudomonadota bacterium]